jgi:thiosulfate/3-mercaptopyruvate sulfurtransferase
VHLNSSENLDRESWIYLPTQDLVERAKKAGLTQEDRIITYCGCGISASLGLLALHLAGFQDLALYDGSWEEWGTDPTSSIETG